MKLFLASIVVFFSSQLFAANKQIAEFKHPHKKGELIVSFAEDIGKTSAASILSTYNVSAIRGFSSSSSYVVEMKDDIQTVARELLANPQVVAVSPNYILKIIEMPDDPDFDKLYGLENTGQTGGTAGADIKARQAWEVTTGSRDVLVAVIDTGVDYTHPDLADNYWYNQGEMGVDEQGADKSSNGVDDDGNGFVDDFRGWDFADDDNDPKDGHSHGTHCAGTIGGVGNNGVGVTGVNWEVSIVGVQFLSAGGFGSTEGAIRSIEYATSLGVDVMSNSWGGGGYSQPLEQAIQAAEAAGILFVAASGNDGANTDRTAHYPSTYDVDNVVSVAASDHNDQLASFSNYGAKTVDVAAPGVDIYSTVLNGGYGSKSGTSMATPHVAGAAALLLAKSPGMTYQQVKDKLMLSSDMTQPLTGKVLSGGRLNVAGMVDEDSVAPSIVDGATVDVLENTEMQLSWNPSGDDGDEGSARSYEVRYSSEMVTTEEQWQAAARMNADLSIGEDRVVGKLMDLPFNMTGYLALRAIDNAGNRSALGEGISFALKPVRTLLEESGESLSGVSVTGDWGIEDFGSSIGMVFSDSPGENYRGNADDSLTLREVSFPGESAVLSFRAKLDFERGYDFAHVEIKTNTSADWQEIAKYTDVHAWQTYRLPLSEKIAGSSSFQVRFRTTSDGTVEKDGWKLRDVVVVASP